MYIQPRSTCPARAGRPGAQRGARRRTGRVTGVTGAACERIRVQPEQPSAGGRWSNLETKFGEMMRNGKEYINRWRKKTACLGGFAAQVWFQYISIWKLIWRKDIDGYYDEQQLGKDGDWYRLIDACQKENHCWLSWIVMDIDGLQMAFIWHNPFKLRGSTHGYWWQWCDELYGVNWETQ